MKKLLSLLALMGASLIGQAQTVAVTADLKSLFNGALATKTQVCFSLTDGNGNQLSNPRTSGGVVVGTTTQCVSPDGSGHVSANVIANDQITPANSIYSVTYMYNGRALHGDIFQFALADGTENLNTKTSLSTIPVIAAPTGDSTYLRLDGGNNPLAFLTVTGNETLGGVLGVAGALSAQRILNRCDANKYTGADWSVQMLAAIADANCTIIDGSNLNYSVPSSVTVQINNGKHIVLPCATIIGGAAVNPVFQVNNFNSLVGVNRFCTIISTNSGTADVIKVTNGVNSWRISDLLIQSAVARTAGAGIRVQGGNGNIDRITINPVFDGVVFDVAFVSGNNAVRDLILSDTTGPPAPGLGAAWHCGVKVGGVAVNTVSGITLINPLVTTSTVPFTDAGICIQDGSDTIKIIGGQMSWGGVDSVGVHIETVNGGAAPNQTQITAFTCEAGVTKNCVIHDAGLNTSITGTTMQSSLRGMLINGGSLITLNGDTFQLNQLEGLKIATNGGVTVSGSTFSESSQQTTNTFSDIFVPAGFVNFSLNGNIHKDQASTGKVCKAGIEIAAGGSDFYAISGDINNGNCGTAAISDGGLGAHKISCNPGGPCINGVGGPGFTGEFVTALTTTSGGICFGTTANCLDFGITTGGKYTLSGGSIVGTFAFASGTASMTTALIAAGACGTTVTVAATGVTTSDIINVTRNAAATNANGGNLNLNAWPTTNNVNFNYCNQSAGSVTPGAMTVNWTVSR